MKNQKYHIDTFPAESTLENLQTRFSGSYEAVVPYGGHVVAATYAWDATARDMICVAAVYAYTTEDHGIEAPIRFIKESEISFEDEGHALEWGINLAKLLDDVTSAFAAKEG